MNEEIQTLCNQEWTHVLRRHRLTLVIECNEALLDFWINAKWTDCTDRYVVASQQGQHRLLKDREGWKILDSVGWIFFHQKFQDRTQTRFIMDELLNDFQERKGDLLCTHNIGKSIY